MKTYLLYFVAAALCLSGAVYAQKMWPISASSGNDLESHLARTIAYPSLAQEAQWQGRVIVRVTFDTGGKVIAAEILKGLGLGCDEAALNAVRKCCFREYASAGAESVVIPIRFQLYRN
jgi:TonB family protein